MKWFLVFLMMPETNSPFNDYYKLNTEFTTEQECVAYVSNPYTNAIIKDHLLTVYPLRPVQNVWCMREDVLKEVMPKGTIM